MLDRQREMSGTHRKRRCKPILPDGRFRTSWDVVQVFLMIWVAVTVPLRVGFHAEQELHIDLFSAEWCVMPGVHANTSVATSC